MGTLDALTGKGMRGRGVVVDAAARRVLPLLVLKGEGREEENCEK